LIVKLIKAGGNFLLLPNIYAKTPKLLLISQRLGLNTAAGLS
jgi:hypothetical protein